MSEKTSAVVDYLLKHTDDRAMLAALRRGLGQPPGTVADMFPYVMSFIAENDYYDRELSVYQTAALFALHPSHTDEGNLGTHLRAYAKMVGDDTATERRFTQLLRLRRGSMDAHLRQHIQILKAKGIPVNWHQFYRDLCYWSHPDHFVQRQWAGAFWRNQS